MTELKNELDYSTVERDRLKAKITRLTAEVKGYRAEIDQWVAEIARLRADNEKLKEWCCKLIEAGDFSKVPELGK